MGVTISHTNYAPLSLVSTCIGFVSFAFTLGTFVKVFWANYGTFRAAPQEINDMLSSLKQGLLEQRRHLRRTRRHLKNLRRDQSHGPKARSRARSVSDDDYEYGTGEYNSHGGKRRSREHRRAGRQRGSQYGPMHFDRDIQSLQSKGEDEALRVLRTTVRDLIKSFRELERPFLKPEYRNQDSAHWSTNNTSPYTSSPSPKLEKSQYPHSHPGHSEDDSHDTAHMHTTNRMGHEYRKCGFKERWLWVKRKAEVTSLSEVLGRVETRRTAHEVGEVLSIVTDIGRDVEDLRGSLGGIEGRLNRVVGVRRVD